MIVCYEATSSNKKATFILIDPRRNNKKLLCKLDWFEVTDEILKSIQLKVFFTDFEGDYNFFYNEDEMIVIPTRGIQKRMDLIERIFKQNRIASTPVPVIHLQNIPCLSFKIDTIENNENENKIDCEGIQCESLINIIAQFKQFGLLNTEKNRVKNGTYYFAVDAFYNYKTAEDIHDHCVMKVTDKKKREYTRIEDGFSEYCDDLDSFDTFFELKSFSKLESLGLCSLISEIDQMFKACSTSSSFIKHIIDPKDNNKK